MEVTITTSSTPSTSQSPVYSIIAPRNKENVMITNGMNITTVSTTDGVVISHLRGHKEKILALAHSQNGKRIASGDEGGSVIIWSAAGEGLLRYSHSSPITSLSFNPVTGQLASGSEKDIGLWSAEQQTVDKIKISSPSLLVEWSEDGLWLICGFACGKIRAYDRFGKKRWKLIGSASFQCVAWISGLLIVGEANHLRWT